MATFFSAAANQRDVAAGGGGGGGDMPFHFHHYPPSNQYQESSTAGLAPLPASAAASGGDGRNELTFTGATEESQSQRQQLMTTMQSQSGQAMHRHSLLSLSIGAQVAPAAASLYQYGPAASAEPSPFGACQRYASASAASGGGAQAGVAVRSSRYPKAARELLDELVSVQDAVVKGTAEKNRSQGAAGECKDADRSDDKASNRQNPAIAVVAGNDSSSTELSPSEKHDLQNKVTALQGLLDHVHERYRNYRQQMQAVAASLDAAAGRGAARPYTALALQTISRHFRSLRDAIGEQVRSARRSLGEPDGGGGGIHRLRYIDQHLRQQRAAAQQLGMLPHHHHHQLHEQHGAAAAWRPQRGLPESAVSVLRAWLFEHFLHPYPKESEKMMLARQTGLTRGQVSNWFINARVRLWKPMIEEMYREEFGAEMESNSSSENGAAKGKGEPARSPEDPQSPSSAAAMHGGGQLSPFKSEAMAVADTGAMNNAYTTAGLSLHQHRHHHHEQNAGDGDSVGSSRLLQEALAHHGVGGGARFLDFGSGGGGYDGGSVSLTLGLHRHAGAGGVTVVTAEQPELAPAVVRGDGVYASAFDYMDGPDDRQQFASSSSSQLLHDFVT